VNKQKLQKREEADGSEIAFNDNLPSQAAPGRRLLGGLPWAWIILSGVVRSHGFPGSAGLPSGYFGGSLTKQSNIPATCALTLGSPAMERASSYIFCFESCFRVLFLFDSTFGMTKSSIA